jgi:uncharacterized membrane protein
LTNRYEKLERLLNKPISVTIWVPPVAAFRNWPVDLGWNEPTCIENSRVSVSIHAPHEHSPKISEPAYPEGRKSINA